MINVLDNNTRLHIFSFLPNYLNIKTVCKDFNKLAMEMIGIKKQLVNNQDLSSLNLSKLTDTEKNLVELSLKTRKALTETSNPKELMHLYEQFLMLGDTTRAIECIQKIKGSKPSEMIMEYLEKKDYELAFKLALKCGSYDDLAKTAGILAQHDMVDESGILLEAMELETKHIGKDIALYHFTVACVKKGRFIDAKTAVSSIKDYAIWAKANKLLPIKTPVDLAKRFLSIF